MARLLGPSVRAGGLLTALLLISCEVDTTSERGECEESGEALAQVVSRDEAGRARMLVSSTARGLRTARLAPAASAANAGPAAAARAHVLAYSSLLGLEAPLDSQVARGALMAQGEGVHSLANGARIVQLTQRVHDLPVFHARASVLMDEQLELVSLASSLVESANVDAPQFHLAPGHALVRAYAAHSGVTLPADAAQLEAARGELTLYRLAVPEAAPHVEVASVKRVLFPSAERLEPAYHVELLLRTRGKGGKGGAHDQAFGTVLRAQDGAVLWSANLTSYETFQYRVWADPNGLHIPADGPLADSTPYPGAVPDRQRPGFSAPVLIAMEGFNKNPDGKPDPWLAASAQTTLGNNVTAYTDRNATLDSRGRQRNDGYNQGVDVRAQLTADKTFDHAYDTARAPNADNAQMQAAVTQIFYTTNWLHDYYYDSGFDEEAGNAQQDNYGRGGVAGDPLRAEAQDSADSGASSNANMSVLGDGVSPRMQMYVWGGLPNRSLTTEPAIGFEDELGGASYGPQTFEITGDLVLVNDGSTAVARDSTGPGKTSDGCQRFSGVEGRIAVIDRGACTFVDKVKNAQQAGATGVLFLDNLPGHGAVSPAVEDPPEVDIPLLSLSFEDGLKLRQALTQPQSTPLKAARFFRGPEMQRDGTIDNTVVAHEWGHYIHHRLVQCASASCNGMSEGWGDFIALMLVIKDGDAFDGQVYPLSQYASGGLHQSSAYFGIRRAPYSTDMTKNPFTFKHVRAASELPTGATLTGSSPELNEEHNVGEIWASMLFEAYVSLLQTGKAAGRPFEETKRRMADYIVAGMKAAPVEPTFVEQRDAILQAARAMARQDATRDGDADALMKGFAKRGLGAGAVAPPRSSKTLNEAMESFTTELTTAARAEASTDAVANHASPRSAFASSRAQER